MTFNPHILGKPLIERQAKIRHLDIFGKAEQPADTAIGQRRSGVGIRMITFKHQYRPHCRQLAEVVSDTGADDAPADNDDVGFDGWIALNHEGHV